LKKVKEKLLSLGFYFVWEKYNFYSKILKEIYTRMNKKAKHLGISSMGVVFNNNFCNSWILKVAYTKPKRMQPVKARGSATRISSIILKRTSLWLDIANPCSRFKPST